MKTTLSIRRNFKAACLFGLLITMPIISMDMNDCDNFSLSVPQLKILGLENFDTPVDSDNAPVISGLENVQVPKLLVPNFPAYAVLGGLLSQQSHDTNADSSNDDIDKLLLNIPAVKVYFALSKSASKENKPSLVMFNNDVFHPTFIVPTFTLATNWNDTEIK